MSNLETAKDLGQGVYTKEESNIEIINNSKFIQSKRFIDTVQSTVTSLSWTDVYTFTLDNCTIGSTIHILANISNLWEGSEEGECQLVDVNNNNISNIFAQRSVGTTGWAMNLANIIGEIVTNNTSMTFKVQVKGVGSNPRWWYNYPCSNGNTTSSYYVIETRN